MLPLKAIPMPHSRPVDVLLGAAGVSAENNDAFARAEHRAGLAVLGHPTGDRTGEVAGDGQEADAALAILLRDRPAVIAVTGDHSTPVPVKAVIS